MLSGKDIKLLRSLRQKKFRDESGFFTVEGEKMVSEALASGFDVPLVVRKEEVGEEIMAKISAMSSPSSALALVRKPQERQMPEPQGLCLALDGVRDPGNFGTILRIADWFGIDAVYASADSVEFYNPKVIQAGMGAVFRKQVFYCDIPALCRRFAAAGIGVFGTFLNGENIYGASLPAQGLIVMGNEADGISPETAAEVSVRLTVPSFAGGRGAESLNVAVAAAICISEFRRR